MTSKRRGMAIVIVLFFAFCLMILVASMFFQHRNVAGHNRLNLQNQQAFFAARAAIQHILLKAKLFPTEFYDAVEFSQGKNPLCDFSEIPGTDSQGRQVFKPLQGFSGVYYRVLPSEERDKNERPKFFYMQLEGRDDTYMRMGSFYNPDYRYLAPDLAQADMRLRYVQPLKPDSSWKAGKYLDYYIRDCTNMLKDGKHIQPALETNISPTINNAKSWGLGKGSDGFPYTMCYRVTKVNIHAMKELRRYNEEAIEIEVEGSIVDFKGARFTQVQRKIQKITRSGK
ncbi:hypothetical protein KBA41_16870 [Candidatus Ozemobacteraceae bacterium]|nr:hypothetical protein [Candidatus Ozemobacteraceae bacterium]